MPCVPTFGGMGYSSILPARDGGGGFIAYGGCTGFRSRSPMGAPGSWLRYSQGNFSQPGVNGTETCLPGVPANACCPIVTWSSFLSAFVMIYTTWSNESTLYIATSQDGISFGAAQILLSVDSPRKIAYGQLIGSSNSSEIGSVATLAYAAAPPTSPYPRDFVYRTITFAAA